MAFSGRQHGCSASLQAQRGRALDLAGLRPRNGGSPGPAGKSRLPGRARGGDGRGLGRGGRGRCGAKACPVSVSSAAPMASAATYTLVARPSLCDRWSAHRPRSHPPPSAAQPRGTPVDSAECRSAAHGRRFAAAGMAGRTRSRTQSRDDGCFNERFMYYVQPMPDWDALASGRLGRHISSPQPRHPHSRVTLSFTWRIGLR
jgi:hypothetical protein